MLYRTLKCDHTSAVLFFVIGNLCLMNADLLIGLTHSCRTVSLNLTADLLLQFIGSARDTFQIPRRHCLKRRHKLLLCERLKLLQIHSREITGNLGCKNPRHGSHRLRCLLQHLFLALIFLNQTAFSKHPL